MPTIKGWGEGTGSRLAYLPSVVDSAKMLGKTVKIVDLGCKILQLRANILQRGAIPGKRDIWL